MLKIQLIESCLGETKVSVFLCVDYGFENQRCRIKGRKNSTLRIPISETET